MGKPAAGFVAMSSLQSVHAETRASNSIDTQRQLSKLEILTELTRKVCYGAEDGTYGDCVYIGPAVSTIIGYQLSHIRGD